MVDSLVYLFLGDDEAEKEKKINSIKADYLDKKLKTIDFEVVYSDDKELTPPRFNEILSYPSINPSKKRIIFLKDIKSLSKENKDILMRYLKNPSSSLLVLLDGAGLISNDSFVKELIPFVKKISLKEKSKLDTFDLWRAIAMGNINIANALKILNTLLNNREKPLNILGSLIWQWENMRDRVSLEKSRQGFKLLLDTDLKIKTSRLPEEFALEMLIVRLSYLI
jgi:DNA polymerase III delta subunit